MKTVSRLVVQVVISEYTDDHELVDEQVSQPIVLYRKHKDVWAFIDAEVAKTLEKAP